MDLSPSPLFFARRLPSSELDGIPHISSTTAGIGEKNKRFLNETGFFQEEKKERSVSLRSFSVCPSRFDLHSVLRSIVKERRSK